MPHKLVILEWVYKADQDFGFADFYLRDHQNYFDQICFFFQQAAEKFLKVYAISLGLPLKKEHDLLKLLKDCVQKDPSVSSLSSLEESCRFLNSFYFEVRYPDEVFAVCKLEDAQNAQACASKIRAFIKEKLGIEKVTLEEIEEENKKIDKILKASS